jgi:succinate dehydrogenase / fumarate reductase membrane anchor subunit
MPDKAAAPAIMRSTLGQMRGLGSAKSGSAHWWAQRLTAFALIPLTLWFIVAVIRLAGLPRAAVTAWAGRPLVAALLIALVLATFHHLQLGLQAVLEDYVGDERGRLVLLLVMKAVVALLALIAVISVLKLAVSG